MKIIKIAVVCLGVFSTGANANENSLINEINDCITSLRGVTQSINDELTSQRASIGQLKSEVSVTIVKT